MKAVTEKAYTPLNFADPKTGEGIGWEYAAFHNTLSPDAALGTVRDLWADRLTLLTDFISACFAEGTDPSARR